MIILVLVALGLCFGSFVEALVWRLHEQENEKLSKKRQRELSILRGRSMCSDCGHQLNWYDLIPIVSWVSLRGRCRYCSHKIDDTPLAELGMVGLFLISYVAWPFAWDAAGVLLFCFWLVFLVGFVALVIYDLKWMELPNRIVYPLIILAAVHVIFMAITGSISGALADAFWGFLFIGGMFYALFQISGGKWIGGGDVKLSFMIGLLVGGPAGSLMVVFFASFIGTVISLPLMAMRLVKPSSRIPFGPFLLAATVVVYLSGERLVDAYLSLF